VFNTIDTSGNAWPLAFVFDISAEYQILASAEHWIMNAFEEYKARMSENLWSFIYLFYFQE
jgi:hypothetical protein